MESEFCDDLFPKPLHGKHIHISESFDIHLCIDNSTLSVKLFLKREANKQTGEIPHQQKRGSDTTFTFRHGGLKQISIDLIDGGPALHNKGYGTLLGNIAFGIYQQYFAGPKEHFTFHNTMQTDDDIKDNSRRIQFYRRWGFEITMRNNGYYELSAKLSDIELIRKNAITKSGFPLQLAFSEFKKIKEGDIEIPEYSATAISQSELSVTAERLGFSSPFYKDKNVKYKCLQIDEDFVVLSGNAQQAQCGKSGDWVLISESYNWIRTFSQEYFDSDYSITSGTETEYLEKRKRTIDNLRVRVIDRWDKIDLRAELDTSYFSNEEKNRLSKEIYCRRSYYYKYGMVMDIISLNGKSRDAIPLFRNNVTEDGYLINKYKISEIKQKIHKKCRIADKRRIRLQKLKRRIATVLNWLFNITEKHTNKLSH